MGTSARIVMVVGLSLSVSHRICSSFAAIPNQAHKFHGKVIICKASRKGDQISKAKTVLALFFLQMLARWREMLAVAFIHFEVLADKEQ